jgi:hypothetical protein
MMIGHRSTGIVVGAVVSLLICGSAAADPPRSFAGTWDSTIYNRSERPRTVAVRIELADAETALPISDAQVQVRGSYLEEELNRKAATYAPKEREFELNARSGRDGVVVFGLSWSKPYPWDLGEPPYEEKRSGVRTRDVYSSWIKPVDDVEKVQELRVLHPQYQAIEEPFDFHHLLHVGQKSGSELQEPRVFEAFERAWKDEITAPGVKYCVLDLGTGFSGFQDRQSRRPEFFERIRAKDYGTVYREPRNWFSKGEHPQSECGPYFVYVLEIRLNRRSGVVDVNVRRPGPTRASTERRRTAQSDSKRDDQPTREREVAPRGSDSKAERESSQDEERRRAEQERLAREQRLLQEAKKNPLGVVVETLTSSKRSTLGLYPGTSGVVVVFAAPGSPAEAGGLRPGTVIESVTHRAVSDVASFQRETGSGRPGSQYFIGVWQKGRTGKWERANRTVRIPG